MANEGRRPARRGFSGLMAAIVNSGRGLLILLIGILLLIGPRIGFDFDRLGDTNRYILAGLFLVYGGWRIYRGYSNNSNR